MSMRVGNLDMHVASLEFLLEHFWAHMTMDIGHMDAAAGSSPVFQFDPFYSG